MEGCWNFFVGLLGRPFEQTATKIPSKRHIAARQASATKRSQVRIVSLDSMRVDLR